MKRITHRAPRKTRWTGVTVSHVATSYRRYPGELVTFHTRLDVVDKVPPLTFEVTVPPGLELENYRGPDAIPWVENNGTVTIVRWEIPEAAEKSRLDYEITARVLPTLRDEQLESFAVVMANQDGTRLTNQASLTITVQAKGSYLNHLPAFYAQDELMGRFLMLFESFWSPIEGQIDNISAYFDPWMTPSDLLPWLASWLNLALDERWPEERQRHLVQSAVRLYRKRGTLAGLQEYLEIFTDTSIRVIEHRNENLRLGTRARLGATALGRDNVPHTFTVILPDSEKDPSKANERRIIEGIIRAEKPAQSSYTLKFESNSDSKK